MEATLDFTIECPYCGEPNQVSLIPEDLADDGQPLQTIEDCRVCCQPIELEFAPDAMGHWTVNALRDDD